MTKDECIKRWKEVRGMFPTKEENDFVDALLEYVEEDKTIYMPYIYDKEKKHKLVWVEGNTYKFVPAEEWMGEYMRVIGTIDDIIGIDCDGLGSAITVGSVLNNEAVVDSIKLVDGKFYLTILKLEIKY